MGYRRSIAVSISLAVWLTAAVAASPGDTRVADAAMHQDWARVRSLIQAKAGVNEVQVDGTTALHWAVRSGSLDAVKLLLGAGAGVNAGNRYGVTPLFLASENGNAAILEALLKAGADANAVYSEGQTPLMLAARSGHADAVEALLEHGAQVDAKETTRGQTALMWAAAEAHPAVVQVLIAHGADVRLHTATFPAPPPAMQRVSSPYPVGGMTALLFSARQNDLESARALLAAGAAVNDAASDGSTPLLVAILNGHFQLASFLLDHGANPNAANDHGETALYAAVDLRDLDWSTRSAPALEATSSMDMIKLLLARGADPNARLTKKTPLRGNAMFDRRWLNMNGLTPFMRAALSGDAEAMRLLLEHGADPKLTTADHTTALMISAGVGWTEGITRGSGSDALEATQVCLERCGDINARNDAGYTALLGASARGANEVVRLLVDHGARLDVKTKSGLTPLDLAEGRRGGAGNTAHDDTAELIRKLASNNPAVRPQ